MKSIDANNDMNNNMKRKSNSDDNEHHRKKSKSSSNGKMSPHSSYIWLQKYMRYKYFFCPAWEALRDCRVICDQSGIIIKNTVKVANGYQLYYDLSQPLMKHIVSKWIAMLGINGTWYKKNNQYEDCTASFVDLDKSTEPKVKVVDSKGGVAYYALNDFVDNFVSDKSDAPAMPETMPIRNLQEEAIRILYRWPVEGQSGFTGTFYPKGSKHSDMEYLTRLCNNAGIFYRVSGNDVKYVEYDPRQVAIQEFLSKNRKSRWNLRVGTIVVKRGTDAPRYEFMGVNTQMVEEERSRMQMFGPHVELKALGPHGRDEADVVILTQQEFCTGYEEAKGSANEEKKALQAMLDVNNQLKEKTIKSWSGLNPYDGSYPIVSGQIWTMKKKRHVRAKIINVQKDEKGGSVEYRVNDGSVLFLRVTLFREDFEMDLTVLQDNTLWTKAGEVKSILIDGDGYVTWGSVSLSIPDFLVAYVYAGDDWGTYNASQLTGKPNHRLSLPLPKKGDIFARKPRDGKQYAWVEYESSRTLHDDIMQTGHRVVVERVFPDATWPRLTFRSLEGGILALDKHASGSVGPYDVSAEEFEKHMEVVSEKKSSKPVKSATEWDTVNNEVWNLRVGAVVVERGDAYSDKPRWEFVQLHSKWSGREACKHSLVELAPLDARGNRTGEPIMVQQQEFCTRYEEWCTDSHMCSKSTAMAEVIRANDEQHKKMHQAMLDCKNASKKKMAISERGPKTKAAACTEISRAVANSPAIHPKKASIHESLSTPSAIANCRANPPPITRQFTFLRSSLKR